MQDLLLDGLAIMPLVDGKRGFEECEEEVTVAVAYVHIETTNLSYTKKNQIKQRIQHWN